MSIIQTIAIYELTDTNQSTNLFFKSTSQPKLIKKKYVGIEPESFERDYLPEIESQYSTDYYFIYSELDNYSYSRKYVIKQDDETHQYLLLIITKKRLEPDELNCLLHNFKYAIDRPEQMNRVLNDMISNPYRYTSKNSIAFTDTKLLQIQKEILEQAIQMRNLAPAFLERGGLLEDCTLKTNGLHVRSVPFRETAETFFSPCCGK